MFRPIVMGAVVAALGVASGAPAWALRPEVAAAQELFEDLRYDRAREAFRAALALEGNRYDDLASIYLHLGILAGAENDEEQAEELFRRALAVDPFVNLPDSLPPKITGPYARARAYWGEERLRIVHRPPQTWAADAPAALRFEITDDRMEMVTGARLYLWSGDAAAEASGTNLRQDGVGPFVFPIPPALLERQEPIRYRIEILGTTSSVLLEMGHDEELAVEVVASSDELPPETGSGTGRQEPERRPVYRTWWFWTILGVVVAGAVTGTVVGLTTQDEGVDFGSPEVVR